MVRSPAQMVNWCQDPRCAGPVAVTEGELTGGGQHLGVLSRSRTGSGSISPTMSPCESPMKPSTRRLYVQGRGALKRELVACLRTGRALRVPRARTRRRRRTFVAPEIMITQRPAEADDRAVPGHWEGDLERHEALTNRVVVGGATASCPSQRAREAEGSLSLWNGGEGGQQP